MSAEEDDEADSWNDFTTASPWETFILEIENQLAEWKLGGKGFGGFEAEVTLRYGGESFTFSLFCLAGRDTKSKPSWSHAKAKQHFPPAMLSLVASSDFDIGVQQHGGSASSLFKWFGVSEFLLLVPAAKGTPIDVSEATLLLSSLRIAMTNSNCAIPAFVRLHESSRSAYLGFMSPGRSHGGASIRFETDIIAHVGCWTKHFALLYVLYPYIFLSSPHLSITGACSLFPFGGAA